jgi:hypothetical protein
MIDKTYIVNDQPIPKERRDFADTDALDFTPYVETLADIASTGNTPLTIGVFGT